MASLPDFFQKAVYFAVGIAATAGETTQEALDKIRNQAQKIASDMVAKGAITTDEARRYVDELVKQAKDQTNSTNSPDPQTPPQQPRKVEIVDEEEENKDLSVSSNPNPNNNNVDQMKQEVQKLQEELEKLKKQK